tara:strand:- start:4674 stop:5048 length:375 start_codon:yes stop_codon:yes gene_type:complete
MTSREMYKEHILDLYKNPLNYGELKNCTNKERKMNPLCGDDMTVQLIIKNDIVKDIKFLGKGCALSIASASLITETVKGMKVEDVKKLSKDDIIDLLEIKVGPVRIKCVLLFLEILHNAVNQNA